MTCAVGEFAAQTIITTLRGDTGSIDIAAQKQASIGGTVFNDPNKNAEADTGEAAAGRRIRLYKAAEPTSPPRPQGAAELQLRWQARCLLVQRVRRAARRHVDSDAPGADR